MSVLTLVRHGQASLFADNYDELSALGREQARLLGEFWVRRQIDFDEVYCGPRARQRQTAEIVGSACTRAGRTWPEPVVLAELDEYDLGSLLHTLAPDCRDRTPPSRNCWRAIGETRTAPTASAASGRCSKR